MRFHNVSSLLVAVLLVPIAIPDAIAAKPSAPSRGELAAAGRQKAARAVNVALRAEQRLLAGRSKNPIRDAARALRLRALAHTLSEGAKADDAADAMLALDGDWAMTQTVDREAANGAWIARRDLAKTLGQLAGKSGQLTTEQTIWAHFHATTGALGTAEAYLKAPQLSAHAARYPQRGSSGQRKRNLSTYVRTFNPDGGEQGEFTTALLSHGAGDIVVDAGGGEGRFLMGLAEQYHLRGVTPPRLFSIDREGENWQAAARVGRMDSDVSARVQYVKGDVMEWGTDGAKGEDYRGKVSHIIDHAGAMSATTLTYRSGGYHYLGQPHTVMAHYGALLRTGGRLDILLPPKGWNKVYRVGKTGALSVVDLADYVTSLKGFRVVNAPRATASGGANGELIGGQVVTLERTADPLEVPELEELATIGKEGAAKRAFVIR